MSSEVLSGRPLRLLRRLYEQGEPATTYTVRVKQSELADQLGISRQALNVHLRKLRDFGYIRTGRGFIDITEEGLRVLGVFVNPAFVFIKISPLRREEAYQKILEFSVQRAFRVAGDMDVVIVVEREKLNEALRKLAIVEGVQDTKSYITIQTLK
ncbi:MAG: Lrp/AsnC family transcriptional regulator [Candidatus Bathyarchaeota archaeon]|nr:MAG: Lrp/AsnC family transcriptional regulator [Candidatus Bathyarchaeota archaeon]